MLANTAVVCTLLCALAQEPPELVSVAVARHYIPSGTKIDEPSNLFRLVRYVKEDAPRNTISELPSLRGKYLTRTLAEDQPLKIGDVSSTPPGKLPISPAMRAVTVPIEAGAEKVTPQVRVDVVLMSADTANNGRGKVLFRGVRVLELDHKPGGADNRTRPPNVTLLVSPDQAKELLEAQKIGWLRVVISGSGQL
jgi:Flp pilus assembly protein CpaB